MKINQHLNEHMLGECLLEMLPQSSLLFLYVCIMALHPKSPGCYGENLRNGFKSSVHVMRTLSNGTRSTGTGLWKQAHQYQIKD